MAAVFITRAMGWEPPEPLTTSFDDVSEDHKNLAEIETLLAHCVVRGCNDGKSYCPDRLVSRAVAAVMIARTFDLNDANECIDPEQTGGGAGSAGETGEPTRQIALPNPPHDSADSCSVGNVSSHERGASGVVLLLSLLCASWLRRSAQE